MQSAFSRQSNSANLSVVVKDPIHVLEHDLEIRFELPKAMGTRMGNVRAVTVCDPAHAHEMTQYAATRHGQEEIAFLDREKAAAAVQSLLRLVRRRTGEARDWYTLATMFNSGDCSAALATLRDDSHAKFLLVPQKVFMNADVDAAWAAHACHAVRINVIVVHRLLTGVIMPGPGLGIGFLVDLDGMPPALRGRVVMTCSQCIGFDGMNKLFAAAV
jgi:hypothetical protein